MSTPVPSGFDDQQIWGGQAFAQTGAADHSHQVHHPPVQVPSHAGILASSSDDLFHPNLNTVPFPSSYNLPEVPYHRNYPAYMPLFPYIPVNREHLSQFPLPQNPHPLPNPAYTSYNNPNFIIPSPPPFVPATPSPYINQNYQHHHQQYQNPTLPPSAPVQYIYYVPQPAQTPSPSPTIPVPKTLPTVSHVPVDTVRPALCAEIIYSFSFRSERTPKPIPNFYLSLPISFKSGYNSTT